MAKRRRKGVSTGPGLGAASGSRRVAEMTKNEVQVSGLGTLVQNEGTTASARGGTNRTVSARCSCNGENVNCYKCDGTGYYEKKIAAGAVGVKRNANAPPVEVTYSNDARGGAYGIRENGRFSSLPLADDYDS